ncbi:transposase domain-containing protein [Mycolicibacterium vaccae]|uniref:transposase domain-containing protein n=1 Tax=Mycolicibacterium vaccae TaxID=1810 RepID=UPI00058CF9AB|nr:transposase domain-containing protein [Mycolicibacterium vaccae]MCV7059534.1 transposase domain-containing protein [Mycolicibacterium vaccae]
MSGVSDRLALSALVGAIPVGMVETASHTAGVVPGRVRSLPPWVTTYHLLASAMCPLAGYDDITDLLWTTLPAATGRGLSGERPTRSAVTRARSRLGTLPLALLLRETVRPVSAAGMENGLALHRYRAAGMPGLWWITDAGTGALRACDARGADLDTAAALLDSVSAAQVTVDLPASAVESLQQRAAAGLRIVAAPQPAEPENPFRGLRARTADAWRQDALARACVTVALEKALVTCRARV